MKYGEKKLWQYSLLDQLYFLVNFQNSHTRVVCWGNTGKYTPSRAGPIVAFAVLAKLYWEFIFHSISNTFFLLLFWHNSHGTKEIPDCGNLVTPDRVEILRWPGCSSGFPSGFTLGKSRGAALAALRKPGHSLLSYSD